VSISVIPSERPVRNASSSSAAECFPCPRCQEPWPIAGTLVPSRNLTVWAVDTTAVAASRVNAPDKATNEPSATQSPLNSRRFNNLAPLLFATCPSKTVSVKQMLPTNFSYGTALDDPGPQDCGTHGPGHDDRHANRKLTELPLWIQMRLCV